SSRRGVEMTAGTGRDARLLPQPGDFESPGESPSDSPASLPALDAARSEAVSLGREALNWDARTWAAIDNAVHEENVRAGVAAKVIPLSGPFPQATTVPKEAVDPNTLAIDESG